jgi:hypothetical protein
MKKIMIDYIKRGTFDELYTPEYAIKPLLKYISKNAIIWECTDYGESNITKLFRKNGNKVITTKIDTLNFLIDEPTFDYDIIITNPPYSLKDEFIERCYNLKKPFALLLPITSLEGIKRGKMFESNGVELMVLDKRVDFTGKKSCWFNTSWFCKDVLPKQLIFEELIK